MGNVPMEDIIQKALCSQCKHFKSFDLVNLCDLGRVKEFKEDGSLTECDYWEGKKR